MNVLLKNLSTIRANNRKNTGAQMYVKTKGDAYINPINYTLKELSVMFDTPSPKTKSVYEKI